MLLEPFNSNLGIILDIAAAIFTVPKVDMKNKKNASFSSNQRLYPTTKK